MPTLAPEAIVGIISAIVGSTSLGVGLYENANKPAQPTIAQLTAAQQQSSQLNPAQLANAVSQAKGTTQANTSGSVAPDYLSQLIQSQYGGSAGNPGVIGQQAAQQWGGSFGAASSGGTGSGGTFGSGGQGVPFGNASSAGLGSTGLTGSANSEGFNISDWLKQLQQGG